MSTPDDALSEENPRTFNFAYLVLAITLLLTIGTSYIFYDNSRSKDAIRFGNEVSRIQSVVENRINIYGALLNGSRGFIQIDDDLNRTKFHGYVSSLNLERNYPGIRRIGFIKTVTRDERNGLIEKMKGEGYPDFDIYPTSEKDLYQALIYLEPLAESDKGAVGFDIASDTARQKVLETATDLGSVIASGKLSPLLENDAANRPVVALFLPVYRGGVVPETVEERKALLEGFVYGSFQPETFLTEIMRDGTPGDLWVKIYDNEAAAENLLAAYEDQPAERTPSFTLEDHFESNVIDVKGRNWYIEYGTLPLFMSQSSVGLTPLIFLTGICFSLLLFGLTYKEAAARAALQRTTGKLHDARRQREILFEKEQRSRVKAEQANLAKDEFIGIISHELKTPLNAIAGWTTILRDEDLSRDTKETALMKIERNLRMQAGLIEQILNYSDIMSQRLDMDGKPVNISNIFEDSYREVVPAAEEKHVGLNKENRLNGHLVMGDEEKLRIVFMNLLSNAIKFTSPEGLVDARIYQDADSIRFEIEDNGSGISSADLGRIFEHYQQADGTRTRAHGGLGLGLTISKHIVKLHHGTISAESEGPGKGSKFTVKLPYKKETKAVY